MKEDQTEEVTKAKIVGAAPKRNNLMFGLIALLIIFGVAAAWFSWKYKRLTDDKKQLQSSVNDLSRQLTTKIDELAKAKITPTPTPAKAVSISKTLIDNVSDAITSKNTAALEGHMASSVNIVLAASEGVGSRTPTQAVSDLNYLDPATSPWDFSLPATSVVTFRGGFYSRYFSDNTIVGQSANGYVVSFGVNSSNKIETIFMAVNADLLK